MGIFEILTPLFCIVVIGLIVLAAVSIRVVPEYERGVVFRLGRLVGAKGPGLFFSDSTGGQDDQD